MSEHCKNCRYYRPIQAVDGKLGRCVRRSHQIRVGSLNETASWPIVKQAQWCGEYAEDSLAGGIALEEGRETEHEGARAMTEQDQSTSTEARVPLEPLVRRGPVQRVPIQITLQALVQDNGDGTWSATVPVLSLGVETGPSLEITLQRLADALSVSFAT